MQPRRRRPPPTGKRKAARNMPAVAGAIRCGRSTSRRGTSTHTSRSRRRRGSRRKPEEALSWIERGTDIAGLKRSLLDRLGRGSEALEDAWAEYRKHPNKYAYDELMQFVPKAECATWHRKAIEVAEDADLYSLIRLALETGEMDRLADLVRRSADGVLEQVSHYAAEPAATKLEKRYPDAAVRLWRAQGMRIVQAKKSKYYDAALSNFERAWRCYKRAGFTAEWEKTVSRIRAEHHRKYGV